MNHVSIYLCIAIMTFLSIIPYYYSYKIGFNEIRKGRIEPHKTAIFLYKLSIYPTLIWYILPFLEQPRIIGLYDLFRNFNYIILIYCILCFVLFLYLFFIWGNRSVNINLIATKEKFYAPKKLLTDDLYGKVQHPMIISDILAHFSILLLTGGVYCLLLFPIYIILDLLMVRIQVKYSLEPYFKEELKEYRKNVPAYFNQTISLITAILLFLLLFNIFYFFR